VVYYEAMTSMSTAAVFKFMLHSPDLVLGLLMYRDNMYMKSNLTNDVISHDYKLTVLY